VRAQELFLPPPPKRGEYGTDRRRKLQVGSHARRCRPAPKRDIFTLRPAAGGDGTASLAQQGEVTTGKPGGLSPFGGVFTPSMLMILGVIMYLRFGGVVGNAGLPGTLLIVTISTGITFLTSLSSAAISTDQRGKPEGTGRQPAATGTGFPAFLFSRKR
jgi:hypothetical protein